MKTADFSSLPLPKEMLDNLKELGYASMTPIQALSLPYILQSLDVIAQAKTGSGKTAAFGIGLLNRLNIKNFRVQSLVLCPTRELADQVAKELRRLARFAHNIKILTLCGGTPFGPQLGSLRHNAHIIVGTPGRVLQHLDKGSLSLKSLEILVLDEADRMLDMGFAKELEKVISYAPAKRQTLLFSATYPTSIMQLSKKVQKEAVSVKAASAEKANEITEYFYATPSNQKEQTLLNLLSLHDPESTIIFCNTKLQTQNLANALQKKGINALAIHGDLEQYDRIDALVQFANRSCIVLVATDVAARGLDIDSLAMVVNFDLGYETATYTHRIGRTARAGKKGLAITLYNEKEADAIEGYRNETRIFKEASSLKKADRLNLKSPNATIVIEGGKKDKLRPGDILGALSKDAKIEANHIGKIDIFARQSYVAVDKKSFDKAFNYLKNGKIKGRKFSVWKF